jgi:transposase
VFRRDHELTATPEPQPALKKKVALATIKGEKTLAEQFNVHANQITSWCTQLLEEAAEVFRGDSKVEAPRPVDVKELHAKIGGVALTNDVFAGALTKAGLLLAKR